MTDAAGTGLAKAWPRRDRRLRDRKTGWLRSTALAAALTAVGPAHADNQRGGWSTVGNWPLVAIHSVLIPDGRVLTYGTNRDGTQTGRFTYDVWDPTAGLGGGHLTLPNSTTTDLFCSAHIVLPQSNDVLMAGGDNWTGTQTTNRGNPDTTLFDPDADRLSSGPTMRLPRWYATLTTLPSGQIYAQGGRDGEARPELRAADGTFRLLDGVDTSRLWWWYPRNFVVPDGRIFGIADRDMYFVDTAGGGTLSGVGVIGGGTGGSTSSEVMYAPGKILRCGGGAISTGVDKPGSAAAITIHVTGPVPKVAQAAPMPGGSHWHTATVGADGRVFVTGGAVGNNYLSGVATTARIWNPKTGTWTNGAATASGKARLYHSTALLLPDASILVAGGGSPGPQLNTNAEIYYPPYLYDTAGSLARRPRITAAPASVAIGQTFALTVDTPASIRRVTLVKTGAATHGFDMDQRFLDLRFSRSGTSLQVKGPANAAQATPGTYLLFVINGSGVPSVGKLVSVPTPANPAVKVDHTPAVGEDMQGAEFTLACPAGSALVGLFGGGSSEVSRVGPRCAAINRQGVWQGSATDGSSVGSGGTTTFIRTCAANSVVTGFRAQSSNGLIQVDLSCQKLGGAGRATGTKRFLGPVGGTAGAAHGPFSCGTGNPAYALYGRADGNSIRSLGLLCRKSG